MPAEEREKKINGERGQRERERERLSGKECRQKCSRWIYSVTLSLGVKHQFSLLRVILKISLLHTHTHTRIHTHTHTQIHAHTRTVAILQP